MSSLPVFDDLIEWSILDVSDWLRRAGFNDNCISWFEENYIDGVKLMDLPESRIKSIPGVPLKVKNTIFKEIEKVTKVKDKRKGAQVNKLNKTKGALPPPLPPHKDYGNSNNHNHHNNDDDWDEEEWDEDNDMRDSNGNSNDDSDGYEEPDEPITLPAPRPKLEPPSGLNHRPPPRPPKNDQLRRQQPQPKPPPLPLQKDIAEVIPTPRIPTREPQMRKPAPQEEDEEEYIIPESSHNQHPGDPVADDGEDYEEPTTFKDREEIQSPTLPTMTPPPIPSSYKPQFGKDNNDNIRKYNVLPNKPDITLKKPLNSPGGGVSAFQAMQNKFRANEDASEGAKKPAIAKKPAGGIVAQMQQKLQMQQLNPAANVDSSSTVDERVQPVTNVRPSYLATGHHDRPQHVSPGRDRPPLLSPGGGGSSKPRTPSTASSTSIASMNSDKSDGSGSGTFRPPPPPLTTLPTRNASVKSNSSNKSRRALPPVPGGGGGEPQEDVPMNEPDDPEGLYSYEWYHGQITRGLDKQRLEYIAKDGCFLVRKSTQGDPSSPYTLSAYYKRRVWYLKIRLRPDKKYALGNEKKNEETFKDVPSMIKHHKSTVLILAGANGGETTLNCSPPKH